MGTVSQHKLMSIALDGHLSHCTSGCNFHKGSCKDFQDSYLEAEDFVKVDNLPQDQQKTNY